VAIWLSNDICQQSTLQVALHYKQCNVFHYAADAVCCGTNAQHNWQACHTRAHTALPVAFLSRTLQPKNYLDFITNYKTSLAAQRKENSDTSSRLSNGLAKLVQASAEVDVLQKELSQAKVVVEAATQECNQLLEVRTQGSCMWLCLHASCAAVTLHLLCVGHVY
jgi:hypothetical protein